MNYRKSKIKELKLDTRWLEKSKAKNAYDFAMKFSSTKRYGLNEETVSSIEQLIIDSDSIAKQWLSERLDGNGTVQVVYSSEEVFIIPTKQFLDNWQQIFLPARDDALIVHNLNKQVVFYCHEEELEIGERNA